MEAHKSHSAAMFKGEFKEYSKALHQGIKDGWLEGKLILALHYLNGDAGFTKDLSTFKELLYESADEDYHHSQYYLSFLNATGKFGFVQNMQEAKKWAARAAANGSVDAMYDLGNWAFHNDHNVAVAIKWHTKAAKYNFIPSMHFLSQYYECYNDSTQSFKWDLAAAKLGDPQAQCNVAISYYEGIGVKKERKVAHSWLRKAVDQNYPFSCYLRWKWNFSTDHAEIQECEHLLEFAAAHGVEDAVIALQHLKISEDSFKK